MTSLLTSFLTFAGLLVLAASLLLPVPHALDTETWRPLFDSAHLPVFGALSFWLIRRFHARGSSRPGLTGVAVTAGIAVIVELIQPFSGRSESLLDAVTGIAGALIVATAWHIWKDSHSPRLRLGHALLSLGLAVIVLWPSLLQGGAWLWQRQHFPALGDFESSLGREFWTTYPMKAERDCPSNAKHGARAFGVETTPHLYSGVRYQANDSDWTGRDRLLLNLYVPAGGPRLALRIDDKGDATGNKGRFTRKLELSPGWNEVAIRLSDVASGTAGRGLNLAAIRQLLIFAGPRETQPGLFCLDYVRLE